MKPLALPTTILGCFGIALLILLVLSLIAYRNIHLAFDTSRGVAHTHEVLADLEKCLSLLTDAETGQRGYIITGDEHYLKPYQAAVARISQDLTELQRLTADNPNQQQRLATLEPLITQKLAGLEERINLRTAQGFAAAQEAVRTGQGKQQMDAIRAIIQDMQREEHSLLQQREAAAAVSARATLWTCLLYTSDAADE